MGSFLVRGERPKPTSALGRIFRAYVAEQLDRLGHRHVVVAGAELTGALGQSRRCDVLVAQVGVCVAMEASVQAGPQEEADQRPRDLLPRRDSNLQPAELILNELASVGR